MGRLSCFPPIEPRNGALKANTPPSDANRRYPPLEDRGVAAEVAVEAEARPKMVPPSWLRLGLELAVRVTLSFSPLTVGPGSPITFSHEEVAGLNQYSVAPDVDPSTDSSTFVNVDPDACRTSKNEPVAPGGALSVGFELYTDTITVPVPPDAVAE